MLAILGVCVGGYLVTLTTFPAPATAGSRNRPQSSAGQVQRTGESRGFGKQVKRGLGAWVFGGGQMEPLLGPGPVAEEIDSAFGTKEQGVWIQGPAQWGWVGDV